jgi:hypothetical protein
MRAALTPIVALVLVLGCVYEPVQIARFEDEEDTALDVTAGIQGVEWTEAQLRNGVVLLACLGELEVETLAVGEGLHHVEIEILPSEPATLPAGLAATLYRVGAEPIEWGDSESSDSGDGDGGFLPTDAGLRYEGELELGWRLSLHAAEYAKVEVRAQILVP